MTLTNILSVISLGDINTSYWNMMQAGLEPSVASNHYATTPMEMQIWLTNPIPSLSLQ